MLNANYNIFSLAPLITDDTDLCYTNPKRSKKGTSQNISHMVINYLAI